MRSTSQLAARTASYSARYLLLTVVAAVFLAPFVWMGTTSLKSNTETFSYPPSLLPATPLFENYVTAFTYQPLAREFLNSFMVLVAVCGLTIVVSTMAGYALARVRVRGATLVFVILLSATFVPPETTIVPLYRIASSWGWLNSLTPLIVFTAFITTAPISTFVMRQSFLALSPEYGEAAMIDGAGKWRILLSVYLPMVRPSLATVVVLSAFYSWNQFLEPLIFLQTSNKFTIPLGLTQYDNPLSGPMWNVQLAAAVLSVIPVLIIFLVAQRHVVAGLTAGGIKS